MPLNTKTLLIVFLIQALFMHICNAYLVTRFMHIDLSVSMTTRDAQAFKCVICGRYGA